MPTLSGWTPDDLLKAATLLGAAVAFVIGLIQYRRAQQWKRAEWVAQEMKGVFSDPLVQAALTMIDWGATNVVLYPERSEENARSVWLTDGMIGAALRPHEERSDGFNRDEARIRASFDHFLDGVERFNSYMATGLVTANDLRPYLGYWAGHICRRHDAAGEQRLVQLRRYMDRYGFTGALTLFEAITPRV
jgi:hypothetical protein